MHAVTAFFGEGRCGDALEKTVEANDIAGLGIVLPAVDVNEDEETFTILGELTDFGIGMAMLLEIKVIAALVELDEGTGGGFAGDGGAFDIPRLAVGDGVWRIRLLASGGTQSIAARRATDDDQESDGCEGQQEDCGEVYFGRVHLVLVLR